MKELGSSSPRSWVLPRVFGEKLQVLLRAWWGQGKACDEAELLLARQRSPERSAMFCQPAGSPSRRRVAPCSSPAWEGSPATEGDRIGRRHRLSAQAEVFTASKPAFPSPALVVSSGHLKIIKRILKFSLCSIHLDFHDGKQGDLFRDHNISYEVERALAASAKGTCGIAKRPLRSDRRHVQP